MIQSNRDAVQSLVEASDRKSDLENWGYRTFIGTADLLTHLFGGGLEEETILASVDGNSAMESFNSVALPSIREDNTHRDATQYLSLIKGVKERYYGLPADFYKDHRAVRALQPDEESMADWERRAVLNDWLLSAAHFYILLSGDRRFREGGGWSKGQTLETQVNGLVITIGPDGELVTWRHAPSPAGNESISGSD